MVDLIDELDELKTVYHETKFKDGEQNYQDCAQGSDKLHDLIMSVTADFYS